MRGSAESPLEMFLQRLNSQGLEISSPWANSTEQFILEAVWPELHKAWAEKERWEGCTELDEPVRADWIRAKQCLQACLKLGQAVPAILTVQQLRGSQLQWLQPPELRHRRCHLTSKEFWPLVRSYHKLTIVKDFKAATIVRHRKYCCALRSTCPPGQHMPVLSLHT